MSFRLANTFVRAVLRSPAHRLLGDSLVLVTYTGRRSGSTFTIPVMYAEDGGDLLVYVGHSLEKVWWRNLRKAANVRVRVRGRELAGTGAAIPGTPEIESVYLERFPRAVKSLEVDESPIFVRISGLHPV
jgi:deazaflavin-dependent oxidoreductase (nitroreductase family)